MEDYECGLSAVDWQLLFELRVSILHEKPLPMAMLRTMRARGWIDLPPRSQWISVRATSVDDPAQETLEEYSYTLAHPTILPVGQRELELFSKLHPDEDVEMFYEEEMDDVDQEDDE